MVNPSLVKLAVDYSYGAPTTTSSSGLSMAVLIPIIVISLIMIVALWRVFSKAGKPGWAAIIPIYNVWTLLEIGGKNGALALLILIPFVGAIVVAVLELLAAMEIAKRFGKSTAWGAILLWLLPFGWLILGFGKAQYQAAGAPTDGPAGGGGFVPPQTPDQGPAPQPTFSPQPPVSTPPEQPTPQPPVAQPPLPGGPQPTPPAPDVTPPQPPQPPQSPQPPLVQ